MVLLSTRIIAKSESWLYYRHCGGCKNIPQGLKPDLGECLCGTAEAVPFQNAPDTLSKRVDVDVLPAIRKFQLHGTGTHGLRLRA
jgi:hypothetical protein